MFKGVRATVESWGVYFLSLPTLAA